MYHEHGEKMNKPVKETLFQRTDPEQRYIWHGKAMFWVETKCEKHWPNLK